MKRLYRTNEENCNCDFSIDRLLFSPPVRVQGGQKRAYENILLVESGGRYKLETQSVDRIKILTGSGHFKWARGEISFCAEDIFVAEETGEYEINGVCSFIVMRK